MARKDEPETKTIRKTKVHQVREIKSSTSGNRKDTNGERRKLRDKKGHKKYDSPFSIPGLDSLELGVLSDILVADKMGFKSAFEEVYDNEYNHHSNVDDIYGLLLSEIEHFDIPEEKKEKIHKEKNKIKRCGHYITEIYRSVNPDVYTIGFQDNNENPGVYYYVQYPEDLEYGTAQLVWMKKLFTYRKPLFQMISLMIQHLQGIVNVFDSEDYHYEYSVDYCMEMLHDYKCTKCKVGKLDEDDQDHMNALKKAFHSRGKRGEYTVFTKRILEQKGNLKDMMMCYQPKDKLDEMVLDWLNLSFTIPYRGHSVYDFSNIVWDERENFDGDPVMIMNILGFIWDVDDAIFQEYDNMSTENINNNGVIDPMAYYTFDQLTPERLKGDRKFVRNIVYFMHYSNDVCYKLKELMEKIPNKELNGRNKQRIPADTQLSCFSE